MNSKFLELIDANGLAVAVAKRHIVSVRIIGKIHFAVEVSCVNGHLHSQVYSTREDACTAWEEIMVELEDFS